MELYCTNCGAQIKSENINVDALIAKCMYCDTVFSFADQFPDAHEEHGYVRPEVPMPKGIEMTTAGYGLDITRRWFSVGAIALTVFCVFWDGFMAVWYTIAIVQKQWAMAAFGTIHGLVGVFITYLAVAMYVNRTTIHVERGLLQVQHGPMKWPGNRMLDTNDLEQLYCKQVITHSKNGTHTSYQLRAKTRNAEDINLLSSIDQPEQVLFLEQEIERFLGIADRAVQGEYTG